MSAHAVDSGHFPAPQCNGFVKSVADPSPAGVSDMILIRLLPALAKPMAMLTAVLLAVAVGIAHAQTDEGFDQLFNTVAGPFDIAVSLVPPAPQVGFVNVALKPSLAGTGEAVTDARVLLVAEEELGSPVFEVVAVNTPDSPRVYRANMKFEEAGNWVLHVQLDSTSHGQADFRAPVVVLPQPIKPGAEGGWVFLGVFIVLLAGGLYVVRSIRKAQASQQQAHP